MSVMSAIKRGGSWAWNNALITQAVGGAGLGLLSSGGSGWGALTGAIGGSVGGVAGSSLGNRAQAKTAAKTAGTSSAFARKMNKAPTSFGANTRGPEAKEWMKVGGYSGAQMEVGTADMAFGRSRPNKSASLQHGNVRANSRNFGAAYNSFARSKAKKVMASVRSPLTGHSTEIEAFPWEATNSRGKGQTSITNMAANAQRKQAIATQTQKQKAPTGRGGRLLGAGVGGLVGGGAVGVANAIGSSFGSGERNPYGTTFSGMGNGTVRGY